MVYLFLSSNAPFARQLSVTQGLMTFSFNYSHYPHISTVIQTSGLYLFFRKVAYKRMFLRICFARDI